MFLSIAIEICLVLFLLYFYDNAFYDLLKIFTVQYGSVLIFFSIFFPSNLYSFLPFYIWFWKIIIAQYHKHKRIYASSKLLRLENMCYVNLKGEIRYLDIIKGK